MLAAYTPLVQAIDWTILGGGALLGLFLVYFLWRREAFHLRDRVCSQADVRLSEAAFIVIAFLLADLATTALISTRVPFAATTQPGSSGWHYFVFHDYAGKLTGIVLCTALLWLRRPSTTGGTTDGAPGGATGGTTGGTDKRYSACPCSSPAARSNATRQSPATAIRNSFYGLLAALALSPPVLALAFALEWLWQFYRPDQPPQHVLLRALHHSEWGGLGLAQIVISAVVISPIAEELFFRGILLSAFLRAVPRPVLSPIPAAAARPWPAILLSAAAFGVVHVAVPQSILPLMLFGLGLGWLRLWSGSIWPCIVAHALFNARTILLALIAPELLTGG